MDVEEVDHPPSEVEDVVRVVSDVQTVDEGDRDIYDFLGDGRVPLKEDGSPILLFPLEETQPRPFDEVPRTRHHPEPTGPSQTGGTDPVPDT